MKMMKRCMALFAVVVLLAAAMPLKEANADSIMYVTASYLYLRSAPGMYGAIIGGAKYGSAVRVLSDQNWNFWYHVRLNNGQTGYMYKAYLRYGYTTTATTTTTTATTTTLTAASGKAVSNHAVNLRTGPGYNFNVITLMPINTTVTLLGKSGQWYYVQTAGGQKGYMLASLLNTKTGTATATATVTVTMSKSAYTNHKVNMRTGASTNYGIITTVNAGEWLTVIGSYGSWYKVRYNGQTGWMVKTHVNIVE